MIIVTSGRYYIDIDAYAGMIAYAYLLNLKDIPAKAVSTSTLNESITTSLLNLDVSLDKYEKSDEDKFILVDNSYKEVFDEIVDYTKVIEVIDHHTGFEDYWKSRLKEKAKIEFIGSVATLIFEEYKKENMLDKMQKDIAILLMAGILDNTLNLKAKITTSRDIDAYNELARIANCNNDFPKNYFLECQIEIEKNLEKAIKNDTKVGIISNVLPDVFGQLTVWNKEIILDNKEIVYKVLNNMTDDWIFNLISLSDGKSYIIAKGENIKRNLELLFKKQFINDTMELDNVWLRKEIIKASQTI